MDNQSKPEVKPLQILTRPDSKVRKFEHENYSMADTLAKRTLIAKKTQIGREKTKQTRDPEWVCSYWEQAGHSAKRCTDNPNRDNKYAKCGRMAILKNCAGREK